MQVEYSGHAKPALLLSILPPIAIALIAHPLLPLVLAPKHLAALPPQPTFPALQANIGFALLAFVGAVSIIPKVGGAFAARGLKGRDLCKPGGRISGPWM